MPKIQAATHQPAEVDAYLAQMPDPRRSEVQKIREAVRGLHPEISEQIKWNAPTFGFRGEYLFTFNFHPKQPIRLVFHNPRLTAFSSDVLEGQYADGRRLTPLSSSEEFAAKWPELARAIRWLIAEISAG